MAVGDTRFRERTIRAETLAVLTAAVHEHDPDLPEDRVARGWEELVAARVAESAGVLRPRWRQVLADLSAAPVRYEVAGRVQRAGMRSTISLTPTMGMSLTDRRRLRVSDTEVVTEAVEDAVEIALFDPRLVWPAVQRVLPPSAAVRADGGSSPRDERTVAVLADVPERTALPADVLAELAAADVEVNLVLQVDNGTPVPFVTARHWSLTGDRLLEVRLREGVAEVVEVPTGTIADEVTWLTVGAFDLLARQGRDGRAAS